METSAGLSIVLMAALLMFVGFQWFFTEIILTQTFPCLPDDGNVLVGWWKDLVYFSSSSQFSENMILYSTTPYNLFQIDFVAGLS